MAAKVPGASQTMRCSSIAPLENPVPNTLSADSPSRSRSTATRALMNPTSSMLRSAGLPQQVPAFQPRPMPSG